ncbi:MAG TPA: PilZ domain-containing protein [Thermoanaerobaculia bacterium]|nr:PilZ domain-containing protein [Thermoanaerobaculia bacterium]
MKRLFDLTVEDLNASPVWRYEGGNGVDAVVVEEERDSLTSTDEEVYLAATEFLLPDSSARLGFCFPVDDEGIDYLQPVIITPAGHVRFWFDGAVTAEVLASQWNALGKREDEVFPLTYRCRIPVDGRMVAGTLRNVETSEGSPPVSTPPREGNGSKAADSPPTAGRPDRVRKLFSAGSSGIEKRIAPRRRAEMLVEFREGESFGAGVTSELSRRGMFIKSTEPPKLGPALSLTMHLPGGRTVLLKGRVVRQSGEAIARPDGFALELTEKTDEYDAFLTRLLDPRK